MSSLVAIKFLSSPYHDKVSVDLMKTFIDGLDKTGSLNSNFNNRVVSPIVNSYRK